MALTGKTNVENSKGLFHREMHEKDEDSNLYDQDDLINEHFDKLS